ncbi:MAG TPA: DUF4292 domain-containing protein [Smithella sp.]|nr:DUF4292 domain-containing protein [Smithella sp.]
MTKKKIRCLVSMLFCVLPLLACSVTRQAVVADNFSSGTRLPSGFGALAEDDIFKSLAKIDWTTPDDYYQVKAALILKRPAYLRLELLPLIGTPDFFLTAKPGKMTVYIPSRKEAYGGRPTHANLKRFLPWPMDIGEIIMVLTGSFPAGRETISQEGDLSRRDIKDPSGYSRMIWVRGKNNHLYKMIRKDELGTELYKVQYFYDNDQSVFPKKIVISSFPGTTTLAIEYADIQIEKATDLSVFDLALPDDIEEIFLE